MRRTFLLFFSFLLFLVVLLTSCASHRKMIAAVPMSELPKLEESVINIPLKIYAKPLLENLEARIPKEYASAGWPGYLATACDFRYKYRFVSSGLRFTCVNNLVSLTMSGSYQIAGSKSLCAFGKQVTPWVSGSCGFSPESMRRISINLQSAIHFQPDYTLRTQSGVSSIDPIDRCRMTILSTDVTGMITDQIRFALAAFATSFDRNVTRTNLSSFLGKAGADINKKKPLGNYGYISIHPTEMSLGSINYLNDSIYFTAGTRCLPEISSDSSNDLAKGGLPPLKRMEGAPGFVLNANAAYEYIYINEFLNRLVKNKSFRLNGKAFVVRTLEATGVNNNQVLLKVAFGGSKSGVIYLKGTPVLDLVQQQISVPDLDYSLQSRDLVMNLGKAFFNKKIIAAIRRKAVLDIGALYKQNRARIDSALNHAYPKEVSTHGNTSELTLTALVVRKERLLFQMHAKGRMDVVVGAAPGLRN